MDYINSNKEAWEEAFDKRHESWGKGKAEKFKNEEFPYLEAELIEVLKEEDLKGKTIGQFCCNDGRETLSIMRAGAAKGIGFDIAENMIASASKDAKALGINCEFYASDILKIDEKYNETFDYIFITIGAMAWFKDLGLLFKKVASCLKSGGRVILHEMHPVADMLATNGEDNFDPEHPKELSNSYFRKEPWIENSGMGYLSGGSYESKTFYSYSHTLEAIFTALIQNDLKLKAFKEYQKDISAMFPELSYSGIPLSYILIGEK